MAGVFCAFLAGRRPDALAAFLAASLGLQPHPWRTPVQLLDLEVVLSAGQRAELGEAVVARVERRVGLAQVVPDLAEGGPPVVLRGGLDRRLQDHAQVGQRRGLLASDLRRPSSGTGRLEHLEEDEPVAGGLERRRRTAPAQAVDGLAGLAQPGREPGEVGVAGDDREGVEVAGVEQVHRVDDQRGVGGVLAHGVGELLDRLDRVAVELVLPADEVLRRPVAVGALDRRDAVARELLEDGGGVGGGRVVGVDQDGHAIRGVIGHSCSFGSLPR